MTLIFNDNIGIGYGGGSYTDENFIAKGTTYSIKADGTGDFATLKDAIDFLEGKWSNGKISIKLVEGTHTLTAGCTINGTKFAIPFLEITGDGADKSILSNSTSSTNLHVTNNQYVYINKIKMISTHGTQDTRALTVTDGATIAIDNISFENYTGYCPGTYGGGTAIIGTNVSITDCAQGINLESGIVNIKWGSTINFTNIASNCIWIGGGAVLQGGSANLVRTSANTLSNVTPNTVSSAGMILGLS